MKGRVQIMFRTYINRKKAYSMTAVVMCFIITLSGMLMNSYESADAKAKVNIGKKKLNLYVGQTYKFKNKKYSWKSSRKSVVSVNKKGRIKAKKIGTAKITASLKVGKKLSKSVCNVKVGKYAGGIKLASAGTIILKTGQSSTIKANVTPDKVLYKDIVYSSDNTNVATVDKNGVVRPVSKGTTTVRMTSKAVNSKGKHVSASITVVVMDDPQNITTDIPGVKPGENIIDTTKDWILDDSFITPGTTPGQTAAPTDTPENTQEPSGPGEKPTPKPTEVPTQTPVPTPAPTTVQEYIASLKPDDNSPLVGSFVVKNTQGDNRTVYLLNKNYSGTVKLDIDGYTYSGNDSVLSLLKRLETERIKATNSAGTICVHRTPQETLWTVEFLQTGVKYYFDAKVNDTTFNSDYGLIIAVGNTINNIKISGR